MAAFPVIATAKGTLSRTQFFGEVAAHQSRLPLDMRYAINLCESRQNFIIAFAAAIAKGQTNLLANNDKKATLHAIHREYAQSYFIIDSDIQLPDNALVYDMRACIDAAPSNQNPLDGVDGSQEAVITFTSGSTGAPAPWAKSWHMLQIGARLAAQRFHIDAAHPTVLVATVPHQHMYGLEVITLLALEGYATSCESKPFYPQDIQQACQQATAHLPANTALTLVTTPIHLKSLVQDGTQLPPIARIISATAPLSQALAAQAEQLFDTEVHEIYGCTEAGSVASRRTTQTDAWTPYEGYRLSTDSQNRTLLHAAHFTEEIALADSVNILDDGRFTLLGRHEDMINIGGKRASLAGLNALLQQLDGVKDGVFIKQAAGQDREARLSVVIAMENGMACDKPHLIAQLGQHIDAVFLPRQIFVVATLPRNALGKLQQAELEQLINTIKGAQYA